MATYYVNPENGNDANTGLSFDQAYLTLQRAFNVLAHYDSIVLMSGIHVVSNLTLNKVNIDIDASASDVTLLWDGVGNDGIRYTYVAAGFWVKCINIKFKNFPGVAATAVSGSIIIDNCEFDDCGNGVYGLYDGGVKWSKFRNITGDGVEVRAFIYDEGCKNNTFYNCGVSVRVIGSSAAAINVPLSHNIFRGCTYDWYFSAPDAIRFDYASIMNNIHDFGKCYDSGDYTTLALWVARLQALGKVWPVDESDSQDIDPLFRDEVVGNVSLRFNTPLVQGTLFTPFQLPGACSMEWGRSTNDNSDTKWQKTSNLWDDTGYESESWNGAAWVQDNAAITLDGSGYFMLNTGNNARLTGPVEDHGAVIQVREIPSGAVETATRRIDRDKSAMEQPEATGPTANGDNIPGATIYEEFLSVEIRVSNTTFAQNAGAPAWQKVQRNMDLSSLSLIGQFSQVRYYFNPAW